MAITEDQIERYKLPTRPEKTDASKEAVELDALPPEILRDFINQAIERHVPPGTLEVTRRMEESERSIFRRMSEHITDFVDHGN